MDESKRKARADAIAAMYKESSGTAKSIRGSQPSAATVEVENTTPDELTNQEIWSKTKLTDNIPSWSKTQKRELDYVNSWIKALWEEKDHGKVLTRSPPAVYPSGGIILRAAYFELLCREMVKGINQKLPERVWASQYADLEPLLKTCRAKPPLDNERLKGVQTLLFGRLSHAINDYVGRVKRAVLLPVSKERAVVLHSFFVALGDLHRYQHSIYVANSGNQQLGASLSDESEIDHHALNSAEKYYWQALSLNLNSGKVWNQLAVCALTKLQNQFRGETTDDILKEGELLCQAAYRYLRAMYSVNPFPSRENLLPLIAKVNAVRGLLPTVSGVGLGGKWGNVNADEHRVRFTIFLTSSALALFSRVGLSNALPPKPATINEPAGGGGSRLFGYLGNGAAGNGSMYSGDTSNDTWTLARRHLRLWIADLSRAGLIPSGKEGEVVSSCQFNESCVEVRRVLSEIVLMLLTTAFAIGQDILKKQESGARSDVGVVGDEAWDGIMFLLRSMVEELLVTVPDSLNIGALYLVTNIILQQKQSQSTQTSSGNDINAAAAFESIAISLISSLELALKSLCSPLSLFLNRLVARDVVSTAFRKLVQTENVSERHNDSVYSWEDQEARGFICWSFETSQSSESTASLARMEPKSDDWFSLVVSIMKYTWTLTKEPDNVLLLSFNQRGRPHFKCRAVPSTPISSKVSPLPANNVDSVLDLLKGLDTKDSCGEIEVVASSSASSTVPPDASATTPTTSFNDQNDDDSDEEFLLMKPLTKSSKPIAASSGGRGGGSGTLSADRPPGIPPAPLADPVVHPPLAPHSRGGLLVGVQLPPSRTQQQQQQQQQKNSRKPRGGGNSKGSILPLIVLDAPNIAMRHGKQKQEFSSKGIALAAAYFGLAGHRVVGFVPDFLLDLKEVAEKRRIQRLGAYKDDVRNTQLPNDVSLLLDLVSQGLLIGTPPQDYDDSYCIRYAQSHGGYVVTNDMYRDHIKNIKDPNVREEQRKWTRSHLISYTFVGDEFLPNPNFSFESDK